MPVLYLDWIDRQMVRADPEARFLFGDNLRRFGMGGQAGAMRGEPNAIGVATKANPRMDGDSFFSDGVADYFHAISRDLYLVDKAVFFESRTVYAPAAGLGTGLSELPQRAPKLYAYLVHRFRSYPGEACPWSFP